MKVVITGSDGLVGWHSAVRLHAKNCAAKFKGQPEPYELVLLNHRSFDDDFALREALSEADAVLHFAGVNRAPDDAIEIANPKIATRLAEACDAVGSLPHIVYSNSIHANTDTAYGRSKRRSAEILSGLGGRFTNLILSHIFGECARPRYNNVTATFIESVIKDSVPDINPDGQVELLHAGAAAEVALNAVNKTEIGDIKPPSRNLSVNELFKKLSDFHADYQNNIYPELRDAFTVALFNSYRSALYLDRSPRAIKLNTDERGVLYEAVKGGGGGQTFMSKTELGFTRGNHFHLNKVERFLVVQGEAIIRIRKVLSEDVLEYHVSGENPTPVDMPTLHTHSIENVGNKPLLTLFWTHDLFDPANSDTYADRVLA